MIYADTSFLFSLYCWDANTAEANAVYQKDARRPLLFTPWQRFELRNTVRLTLCELRRARSPVRFQAGNVFNRLDEDLRAGILRHVEPDWRDTFKLAEELSARHTEHTGAGGVDTWHIAAALLLEADTFWTFDGDQRETATRSGRFKRVPELVGK